MIVYQYDLHGYLLGTTDDYGGPMPHNCTAETPPRLPNGFIPWWTGDKWRQAEDHRKQRDERGLEIEGSGTPFWLPSEGDKYDSPPRYMDKPGPLPSGALLEAPELTEAEQAAMAYDYVLAELAALDEKYLSKTVLAGMAVNDPYALAQWDMHFAEAEPWRDRLAAVPDPAPEAPAVDTAPTNGETADEL